MRGADREQCYASGSPFWYAPPEAATRHPTHEPSPMKITCQSCQSKYTLSDEKVQGKTVKIKCRKCGATIVANGAGAAASAEPAAAPAGAADGSYHVNVGDGDQRTMTMAEIVTAYNEGVINQETFVWTDGMDD